MQSKQERTIRGTSLEDARTDRRTDNGETMTDKVFMHGICIARLMDNTAALFFKDSSQTVIDKLNGRIFIGCGRPDIIGMNGEIIDRDSTMAADFARRLRGADGQEATAEDVEVLKTCARLLNEEWKGEYKR